MKESTSDNLKTIETVQQETYKVYISFGSSLHVDSKVVQLAKESPYQKFLLVGANQAKKICSKDNLDAQITLKAIEIGETLDSFGQRQFKLALIDEKTKTQIVSPINDGDFNYANKFRDFIVDAITKSFRR